MKRRALKGEKLSGVGRPRDARTGQKQFGLKVIRTNQLNKLSEVKVTCLGVRKLIWYCRVGLSAFLFLSILSFLKWMGMFSARSILPTETLDPYAKLIPAFFMNFEKFKEGKREREIKTCACDHLISHFDIFLRSSKRLTICFPCFPFLFCL